MGNPVPRLRGTWRRVGDFGVCRLDTDQDFSDRPVLAILNSAGMVFSIFVNLSLRFGKREDDSTVTAAGGLLLR